MLPREAGRLSALRSYVNLEGAMIETTNILSSELRCLCSLCPDAPDTAFSSIVSMVAEVGMLSSYAAYSWRISILTRMLHPMFLSFCRNVFSVQTYLLSFSYFFLSACRRVAFIKCVIFLSTFHTIDYGLSNCTNISSGVTAPVVQITDRSVALQLLGIGLTNVDDLCDC